MKYLVVVVILLGLGAGGAALWYNKVKAASANNNAHQTAKVERGDLRVAVSATGAVASNNDTDIKCRASGEVIKLPFDISDTVAPGAMVLTLDTIDQQRVLDQADAQLAYDNARLQASKNSWEIAKLNLTTTTERVQATLASVNAKTEDLRNKLERSRSLFERKLISKEELETAQTAVTQADAELRQAKVAVDELNQQKIQVDLRELDIRQMEAQIKQDDAKKDVAKRALEYCVVTAPPIEDGPADARWTVSNLQVKIGTLVQSGTSSVSGGAVVMTLSDLSRIFVLATVDESDIGMVVKGQPVSFTSDSFKNEKFEGKVVRIAVTGKNQSNVITYEVKIEVTSDNKSKLKPMMTANVDIISAEKKDVLLVPMQAISRKHADGDEPSTTASASAPALAAATEPAAPRPAAGKGKRRREAAAYLPGPFPATAQVLKPDGSVETREVLVGMNDEVNFEVVKGLEAGDTVVLNKSSANSKFSGGQRPPRSGRGG